MALIKSIQSSPLPDAELLEQYCESDDQQYLATLYMRYSDLVYGTCLKYFKDQETAKDAVMNVYEELLTKVKNHAIDNFKGWLYMVAKNHCLMQLRRNKKMPITEFNPEVVQSEDFSHLDSVFEKEKQLDMLENCIKTLKEDQEQTIRYFYLEDKCYNEICDLTGMEWNKVRSLVQNGRRNLKICMEENG